MRSWAAFLVLCTASLACHAAVAWRMVSILRADFAGVDGHVLVGGTACCFAMSTGFAVLIPGVWRGHPIAASFLSVLVLALNLYTAALVIGADTFVGEAQKLSAGLWLILCVSGSVLAGVARAIGISSESPPPEKTTSRDLFEFVATTLRDSGTSSAEIRVHGGEIITTQRALAAACGMSVATVNRQLAQLRKASVLKVATAGGISRISLEG